MKRSIVYFVAFALLALGACKPKYDEVSPKTGPVTEAVFASGSIAPRDAYIVTSMADGFIVHSYIEENDMVRAGQLLFRLDNKQQNTQVQVAQTNVAYAKLNTEGNSPALLQIKAQIDAARVKMQNDSTTMSRYERLYTTNSVSKQDLDNARSNYKSSKSAYEANVENYRITANKVKQEFANSQSQLQNAVAGNQNYELTAIGAGKVYQVFKHKGDLVRKGDQVAQIGSPDSIVAVLDIDENSISKVQTGQQVLVELNTQKNKTIAAVVTRIYPHFDEKAQSYKVEAKFTGQVPALISGTQLQANIITNKKDNALLIPRTYLAADNKVLVKKGKGFDTVKVTTGIMSYDWVEIVSGITPNDVIGKQK